MLEKLNKLHIRQRLKKSFTLVAGMMAVVAAIGVIGMIVVSNLYADSLVNYGFAQGDVGKAMASFADTRSALRGIIGYDEEDTIQNMVAQHDECKGEFEAQFAELEKTMVTAENKELYAELKADLSDYWALEQQIIDLGATTDIDDCIKAQEMAMGDLAPMYEEIYGHLTEIMDIKVDRGQALSQQLSLLSIVLPAAVAIVIVLSIMLALHLGTGIAEGIAVPTIRLKERLETFAKGDLSSPFPDVDTQDEIAEMIMVARQMAETLNFVIADEERLLGEMARSNYDIYSEDESKYTGDFEQIFLSLRELKKQMVTTIQSIDEASTQVSAGSTNLAEASQSLAEGATEQAGAVQEMQATIMTITDNIVMAAEKAEESYQLAQKYADEADRSRGEMEMMVAAMGRINEASQKIGNIISEIEDIASQTNLLSLNASIEAARAGDAGKGFAVVADEIGKLALESSEAANTTKELISISMGEIQKGNDIAASAMESLKESVNAISHVNGLIQETAENAAVQAENMNQLRAGIEEMAHGIQDNSAASQETSATSQELASQAEVLNQMVQKFELC